MRVIYKKAVSCIFCLMGFTISTDAFAQTMHILPSNIDVPVNPGGTGICGLNYSDMVVSIVDSYGVASNGSVSFDDPSLSGAPISNLSMSPTYCQGKCGENDESCLTHCKNEVTLSGNPSVSDGGTIPAWCVPMSSSDKALQKLTRESQKPSIPLK